jgi:hypothetical protein
MVEPVPASSEPVRNTLFCIHQFQVESFSWRMTSLSKDLFLFHLVVHRILADGMMVPENWTVLFLPHNSQCIIHQLYYSGLCTVNCWKYYPVSHENSNKSTSILKLVFGAKPIGCRSKGT